VKIYFGAWNVPIPPILDVFVVWHPGDALGRSIFQGLNAHFHSASFSGLAGGAVEVYSRSDGWIAAGGAPRRLGVTSPIAEGLPAAQFIAIVPVLGLRMSRAVAAAPDGPWAQYLRDIAALNTVPGVGVYPLLDAGFDLFGSALGPILGGIQTLPASVRSGQPALGREVAQAITQRLATFNQEPGRLKVFVSHTKHLSPGEDAAKSGPALYERVRERIAETHLATFFDAQDLQPGDDWEARLESSSAAGALLMVRTDVYASREWTQREVRSAKKHGVPVVGMYALTSGEQRGSFLMDHVPSVVCDAAAPDAGIDAALNRLVDEALKSALWRAQRSYLGADGFDWLPSHSPEPTTLVPWLLEREQTRPEDQHIWVMHPDPPLGSAERDVLVEICSLAGYEDAVVDVFTPRTFAARGGVLPK
jgi:hypothetical protein